MKRVLALVLAVVLAFGLASTAFAATPKIDGIASMAISENGVWKNAEFSAIDIPPDGRSIDFHLGTSNFSWENGFTPAGGILTSSHISGGTIAVALKKTTGYPTIKEAKIRSSSDRNVEGMGNVHVRVTFISELVSVSDAEFSYDVSLTRKRVKKEDSTITVSGVMKNPETIVSENNDTAYTADGTIVVAEDHIRNLKMEAGQDVYVTMNVFNGGRYYMKATLSMTNADAELIDKYPEIETVITMKTATNQAKNVWNSSKVDFDFNDKYYVYGEDGKYLGTSNETLPFSNKYYLSMSRIEMGTVEVSVPSDAPVDPANPITGGDDVVVNSNNNPSTGTNGFVNVAIVAGVVALAAAGAVSMKKK